MYKCRMHKLLRGLMFSTFLLGASGLQSTVAAQEWKDDLQAMTYKSEEHGSLPYRLYSPKAKKVELLPLVLFLHGAGERGTDNRRQLIHGVRDFVKASSQKERPCFVLAPQCPRGRWWDVDQFLALTESVIAEHAIDPDRVYVTGLSMGGFGTWHAIAARPDLFAAAVPICGGYREDEAAIAKMKGMPIWAFHGGADRVVPAEQSRRLISALKKLGAEPKYTEYKGVGHNSWSATYSDPEMHAWLFSHERGGGVAKKPLVDGDRIVFFGDSITQAGANKGGYIRMIEASAKKLRPKLEVTWVGAGISGHKVPDLQKRIERDVLSKKPTLVIIYIGINDVWHWGNKRGTKKADFDAGLRELIAMMQDKKARVILCTPSVIGEKHDGGNHYDVMLDEYSAISRTVARDTGTQLLDLRALFLDYLRANNTDNKDRGVLTGDAVHLNKAGNRFVADKMLLAMGFELPVETLGSGK